MSQERKSINDQNVMNLLQVLGQRCDKSAAAQEVFLLAPQSSCYFEAKSYSFYYLFIKTKLPFLISWDRTSFVISKLWSS